MKKNVGSSDTLIRIVLAAIIAVLILTKVVTGAAAIVLGIVGAILLITGVIGVCGLYALLGINTKKDSGKGK